MAKILGSGGLIRKRKIAILNIDSVLKVLVTTSPKWVYMLNSVQKWLCESQKKKTVDDGAISI
jgi:hypothetical protein